MIPYIDFHTHGEGKETEETIALKNILYPNRPEGINEILSLHPWYLPNTEDEALNYLLNNYKKNSILGEVGLDKKTKTSWDKQLCFFRLALKFALEKNIPSLTLHSVKSHQDCLNTIREVNYQGHIIFHDFFSSYEEFKSLIKNDNVYVSLGKVLYSPQAKLYKHLSKLPLNRLFLETDDNNITIQEQYEHFSTLTGHNLDEIKKYCYDNYIKVTKVSYES